MNKSIEISDNARRQRFTLLSLKELNVTDYLMNIEDKIFIAGHKGLVGSALIRTLKSEGFHNIITEDKFNLDLRNQADVLDFFNEQKLDHVFLSAAKVGGISPNSKYPVEFLYDNVMIAFNIISACASTNVNKLLYLGSSCIYPKFPESIPILEKELLNGNLEPTNEAYALAKIIGLKLCQYQYKQYGKNFISAMPTNLYGPNDKFDLENSHVIPALMMKIHTAKIQNKSEVIIWGTGKPLREFMYVDDLSRALILIMQNYSSSEHINVGTGEEISIFDLAYSMKEIIGFNGKIQFDSSKPDGTYRKLLDISKLKTLGFQPKTSLKEGLQKTYQWYLKKSQDKHLPDVQIPL